MSEFAFRQNCTSSMSGVISAANRYTAGRVLARGTVARVLLAGLLFYPAVVWTQGNGPVTGGGLTDGAPTDGDFKGRPDDDGSFLGSRYSDSTLSGNWGGLRDRLADRGILPELVYTAESYTNASGGVRQGMVYLGNLDATLELQMGALAGLNGGRLFIYGLGNHGGYPSRYTGDIQVASNIEANSTTFILYQAWYEQSFGQHFSLLAGLHDLNADFYVNESAFHFFHSSFGIGAEYSQSGANGPSIFPVAAPALLARLDISRFFLLAGIYNAVSGDPADPTGTHIDLSFKKGTLNSFEAGVESGTGNKAAVGYWFYSRPVSRFDTSSADSETGYGAYIIFQRNIRRFVPFIHFGFANPEVYEIEYNLSVGVTVSGFFWGRQTDTAGVALSSAFHSGKFRDLLKRTGGGGRDDETALEFNYRWQFNGYLGIQPALMYIFNPAFQPAGGDALAIMLRADITF